MIHGHGDDIYNQDKKIEINFSSNVDTHQNLSTLRTHLIQHISQIHSYPEPDARSLRKLIAEKQGIAMDAVGVTNGATEAIYLIAQAFQGAQTTILIPTFSEYEDACKLNQHQIRFATQLDQINCADLVWICNPNNPQGTVFTKQTLLKLIHNHPKIIFVIDQSYEHFSTAGVFSSHEAAQENNLILLHSMTKHFAIPGLRLGYLTSHPNLLSKIMKFRMPWSVNQLAIEAGKFLLSKYNNLVELDFLLTNAQILYKELQKIKELEVIPSQTHFFLCRLPTNRLARDLKQHLINQYGILIRDASNFRGLTPHHFRIASQNKEQNTQLVKAIKAWI